MAVTTMNKRSLPLHDAGSLGDSEDDFIGSKSNETRRNQRLTFIRDAKDPVSC